MAVLVQPQLDAECGGVLFGLDPVDGDRRHLVVEAVAGTPDALVSGAATAVHCLLGRQRSHRRRGDAHVSGRCCLGVAGAGSPPWHDAPPTPSPDRRTWSGRSTPPTTCGSCRVVR